jgi:shikimate dehydrogenase
MNRAFAAHDIDAAYGALTVPADRVVAAVQGLGALGAGGANVTYPHKTSVLEAVDRVSPAVDIIGAANTLVLTNNDIEAHNTDALGTARALQVLGGVPVSDRHVRIFGAGGAARAAAYGLLDAGAAAVTFAVRDTSRATSFVRSLRRRFPGSEIDATPLHRGPGEAVDIVINATPVGMSGSDDASLLAGNTIEPAQCFFDFVYNPRDTGFLQAARRAGARTVDGLALLVAQAEESFRLWTGKRFSLPDMYEAVCEFSSGPTPTERDG